MYFIKYWLKNVLFRYVVISVWNQARSTNWDSAIDRSIAIDVLATPGLWHANTFLQKTFNLTWIISQKNTPLQLATQAVTDEQPNFVTTAILLHTSVLWFSHIASILADSCILSVRHVWASFVVFTLDGPVWLLCVIVLCSCQALWSSSRSHRRCNNFCSRRPSLDPKT